MAGENVIRKDVVQIGFDIEDSPLSTLQKLVDGVQANVSGMAKSVDSATSELSDMANEMSKVSQAADNLGDTGVGELAQDVEKTAAEARECEARFSEMMKALASNAITKVKQLPKLIQSSASAAREFASSLRSKVFNSALKGAKKLQNGFKAITKIKLSSIVSGLDKRLGSAVTKAKQVTSALKASALSGFTKAVGGIKDKFKELSNAAKQAGDESKNAASKAEGGFTILKGVIADLISNGIMKLIDGVKNFATESVKVGANFDSSMAEVAAISGATGDQLEALRDTAKEYGKSTVFSASESADALKYMALAGWDANQSIAALPGILNLAASSGMELGSASDMVTDYLTAFNMEADQAAYFSDVLAYAQSNSNTTAEMLGEAYKNCAANLNASGQDMETVTALLSQMANQGLKGSEAGTALNAVMRDMTAKMENGAIKIGDTSVAVTDAQGNFRDLTDIMKDVEKATDGMADGQRAAALSATFTEESLKGMNLMLNSGIGEAEDFEKALRGSTGTAEKMAATMNDNLNGDLKNLSSQLEGVRIELYEKFEPALRKGVSVLSKMLSKAGAVANKVLDWASSTKVVNNLKTAFTKVKDAVTPIVTSVGNVIEKIAGFVTSQSTINALKTTFEKVSNVVSPIVGIVQKITDKIAGFVTSEGFINGVKDAFGKIKDVLDKILDAGAKVFGFIEDNLEIILPLVEGVAAAWLVYKTYIILTTAAAKAYAAVQAIVNAVMNANPIGLIITGIGLLIGVIILLIKNWDKVKEAGAKALNKIKQAWGKVKDWFNQKVVSPIKNLFTGLWNGIKTTFANVVTWFKEKFTAAKNGVISAFSSIGQFFSGIWSGITGIFSGVGTWFSSKFTDAKNGIVTAFSTIGEFFSNCWSGITGIFSGVGTWFSEKFSEAYTGLTGAFSDIGEFFSGLWDKISGIFTSIGTNIGEAVGGAFKSVINTALEAVESTINGGIDLINGAIEIINKIPGVKIGTIGEVSFPRLAKGGIVDQPTIAQIGEAGKEAVVPLENNLGWINKIIRGVTNSITASNGGSGSYDRDVITTNSRTYSETNNYNPTFVLNMNGASATDDNKRKVKQWIKEALKETFDDLDKDNMPVVEI